jgi:hypothetical protein
MIRTFSRSVTAMAIALLPLLTSSADPEWPQSLYLPGIAVSLSGRDTAGGKDLHKVVLGRCDILLWVTADGYIRVAQVIKSSGHPRLDENLLARGDRQENQSGAGQKGPDR